MSAPWLHAGMVYDTADYLYEQVHGDRGLVHVSGFGMCEALANCAGMTDAERLDRIRDVSMATAWLVLGLAAVGCGVLLAAGAVITVLIAQHLSSHRNRKRHVPTPRRALAETRELPRYRSGVVRTTPSEPCSPACPYRPAALQQVRPPRQRRPPEDMNSCRSSPSWLSFLD